MLIRRLIATAAIFVATVALSPLVGAMAGASTKQSGRISAYLTATSFTAARAGTVKLAYKFSSQSKRFGYVLSRQQRVSWVTVHSVSKRGSYSGLHTVTIKSLFGTQPVVVGHYQVKVSSSANSVTLSFTIVSPAPPGTHTLTVAKTGTGSGSVTSSPAGIDCGGTCSASFSSGAQVTLTGTPAAGSTFAGWTGSGCSSTSTCQVTMSSDQTISAAFTATKPRPGSWLATVSGPVSGYMYRGYFTVTGLFFTVSPDQTAVSTFGLSYDESVTYPCIRTRSAQSSESTPSPITNNQFSTPAETGPWTGSGGVDFNGTFDSATTAHGTAQADDWISESYPCTSGSATTSKFTWTATWQHP